MKLLKLSAAVAALSVVAACASSREDAQGENFYDRQGTTYVTPAQRGSGHEDKMIPVRDSSPAPESSNWQDYNQQSAGVVKSQSGSFGVLANANRQQSRLQAANPGAKVDIETVNVGGLTRYRVVIDRDCTNVKTVQNVQCRKAPR